MTAHNLLGSARLYPFSLPVMSDQAERVRSRSACGRAAAGYREERPVAAYSFQGMRSATGTAAVWFLIGVAGALSLTSLAIVTLPLAIVLAVVVLRKGVPDRWLCSAALMGRQSYSSSSACANGASPTAPVGTATPAR
jgi:hypothetical protein